MVRDFWAEIGRVVLRFVAFCIALIVLAGAGAQAGTLVREAVPSAALKRDMAYVVYLPDGYEPSGGPSYPVLYLLHGAGCDETVWAERGAIVERADRLIHEGSMPPTIVVMPSCPGCWWVDGGKDKAETAFWTDFVPAIEARYRTLGNAHGRLIAGVSAGGFGAVRFALKYPDRVAAVAALSPAVYAVTPPARSLARRDPAFLRPDGQFNQALWSAENYPRLGPRYFEQPVRVPFYLMSGNSDELGIAFETIQLYKMLAEGQPDLVQLNLVEGRHDWTLWSANLDAAMIFLGRHVPRHHASMGTQSPGRGVGAGNPGGGSTAHISAH